MKTLQDLRRISSPRTQIEMRPGEYLMDIINEINAMPEEEKPTLENPLTIHFYNHSKTIDWDRFTAQIHWPKHVYLNFVGEINWWPNNYYPGMGYDEGLISGNPTDKLFIGFSFNRENDDNLIKVSGLPNDLSMIYFGGLDDNYLEYNEWSDVVLGDVPHLANFRVNGDKADDVKNDALYKMINGVAVDVTPDFRFCNMIGKRLLYAYFYSANFQGADFSSSNFQGASFSSSNCQGANFSSASCQEVNFYSSNFQGASFNSSNLQNAFFYLANLKNSNWYNVISIANVNFQNADLTGAAGLPERINTKAKFIAECGPGNVNAQTIWIDGTSILA